MMTQHEVRNPLSLQFRISEFYQGIICSQVIQGKVHQLRRSSSHTQDIFNPLTPNDLHMSRTAPLTSKRCVLYIYSTNIGTQYFKHALYSPFFSLQNAVCFIMLTCLVPALVTFYIQGVLKFKKNHSGAKGLRLFRNNTSEYTLRFCDKKGVIFSVILDIRLENYDNILFSLGWGSGYRKRK